MTVEKVRGYYGLLQVTEDGLSPTGCSNVSWIHEVSSGIRKLPERCVDTVSFCVNYIFVLLFALCVQHEKGKPGGRAPLLPSTE